jgi:hypothetical protein
MPVTTAKSAASAGSAPITRANSIAIGAVTDLIDIDAISAGDKARQHNAGPCANDQSQSDREAVHGKQMARIHQPDRDRNEKEGQMPDQERSGRVEP